VIHIGDDVIERIIREDVPSLDLTTWTLDLRDQPGTLTYVSREDIVACGTEEVTRICARFGVTATGPASGTRIGPGDPMLQATGDVADLHRIWRVCLKLLEGCSGIATRTARLVERAHRAGPGIEILTTRKSFPGTQDLAVKAVLAGGALPHRLGLSETVLIFEQHWAFCGGLAGLLPLIPTVRRRVPDKRILVEVESVDDALAVAAAGADGVQFDKTTPQDLQRWVPQLRAQHPNLVVLAAGGIGEHNVDAYAATGVDALVTSSIFFGPPADLQTRIAPAPATAPATGP
jgi:molybdenum transport protein